MTIIGACPRCGAPIYSPTVWHGITPPPVTYTCVCYPQAQGMTMTITNIVFEDEA